MNTTKRYSRTMQEAFGPYTSNRIDSPPEPMHPIDKVVVTASVIAAIVLIALVSLGAL